MRLRNRLLSISRWLGTFPSLGYASIYLLLIPVFALLYYSLPNHFYHSTIQYESPLGENSEKIRRRLLRLIAEAFVETHNKGDFIPTFAVVNQWHIHIYQIENLELENSQASFDYSFYIHRPEKGKENSVYCDLQKFDPTDIFFMNVSFDLTKYISEESNKQYESKYLEIKFSPLQVLSRSNLNKK